MRTVEPSSAARAVAQVRSQIVRGRRAIAAQGPAFRWSLCSACWGPGPLRLPGHSRSRGDRLPPRRAEVFHQRYHQDQPRPRRPAYRLSRRRPAPDRGRRRRARSRQGGPGQDGHRSPVDRGPGSRIAGVGTPGRTLREGAEEEQGAGTDSRRDDPRIRWDHLGLRDDQPAQGADGLGRPGTGPGTRPTAFVWLETDGGREISHKTVQSIQNLVVGKEPELKSDAVTVFDQKGRHYLVAGEPKYSTISATRAEEELGQRILEEIDWIDGVRVTVQLVPAPTVAPAPLPALSAAPTTSSPAARIPEATVGVNTPLELESDPPPNPDVASPAPPVPAPVLAGSSLPEPGSRSEVARVWVRVPRSYYFSKAAPDRDPSVERLNQIVARTESLIRVAVEHVVPPELMPPDEPIDLKIKIDTIYDPSLPACRSGRRSSPTPGGRSRGGCSRARPGGH